MSGNRKRRSDAFEALATSFGGRVPASAFDSGPILWATSDYEARGAEMCREAKKAKRPMLIEIGMLGDLQFNAVASKVDGVDLIGMNLGVSLRLFQIFEALMATRHAFPEVGSVASRSSVRWDKAAAVSGPPAFSGAHLAPDSPEGGALLVLVMLAERFIFDHEATHVRHGHVDLIQATIGAQAIDELHMSSRSGLRGIDLQTLEFDADCGGIQGVMEAAYGMPKRMAEMPLLSWDHFGDLKNVIKAVGFAIYTCCQIFADSGDDDSMDTILTRSHPPATFRMHCVSGQLMTVIGTHFYERMHKEMFTAVLDGVNEAHAAWQEVFGGSEDWYELRMRHESRNSELLRLLSDNWCNLYSQLLPLKRYGNLSPPDGLNAWPHVIHRN